MWIKICGNTNLEDAQLAASGGADALGFVFAPSPRRVTAQEAAAIAPALGPGAKKIGVFGAHSFKEIAAIVRVAGIDGAQLHGEAGAPLAEELRREFGRGFFLIQALHWRVDGDRAEAEEGFRAALRAALRRDSIDALLLDAQTAAARGGTGSSFDWARARAAIDEEGGEEGGALDGSGRGRLKIILAGGLHAGNVAEAIRVLRPWGVDVVSGTERAPGKKDPERIRAFIAAAREAK